MIAEIQLLAPAVGRTDHVTVFMASRYHVRNQLPFPAGRRLPVQSAFISGPADATAVLGRSVR